MTTPHHQVFVDGFPGLTAPEAAQRVANAFGITREAAMRFATRFPVRVKSGLSAEQAQQYASLLEELGAKVRIDPPLQSTTGATSQPAATPRPTGPQDPSGGRAPLDFAPSVTDDALAPLPRPGAATPSEQRDPDERTDFELSMTPSGAWGAAARDSSKQGTWGQPGDQAAGSITWGQAGGQDAGSNWGQPAATGSGTWGQPPGASDSGSSWGQPSDGVPGLGLPDAGPSATETPTWGGASASPPATAPQAAPPTDVEPGEVVCTHCGLVQDPAPGCRECGASLPPPPALPSQPAAPEAEGGPPERRGPDTGMRTLLIVGASLGGITLLILLIVTFSGKGVGGGNASLIEEVRAETLPEFYDMGFTARGSVSGESRDSHEFEMEGGNCVAFVAVSRTAGCDLDAAIAVGGREAVFDQMSNSTPVVYYCSRQDFSGEVEVWSFSGDSCNYGIIGFRRLAVGGQDLAAMIRVHAERFLQVPTVMGVALDGGTLASGESTIQAIRIRDPGCYGLVAQSAPNTDLDLTVNSDDGAFLGSDFYYDNYPIVEFCVSEPIGIDAEFSMFSGSGNFYYELFAVESIAGEKEADPGYMFRSGF